LKIRFAGGPRVRLALPRPVVPGAAIVLAGLMLDV